MAAADGKAAFRVVKTNRRGKAQNRVLELNFTDGVISNLNAKGKVQKSHHASKVMFAEKVGPTMLVLHLPDKKDYKLNFVGPEDRDMFCAKLVDLCKECKINSAEPLQEVMFDPNKHASFEGDNKTSFTFRVKATGKKNEKFLEDIILFIGPDGVAICDPAAGHNDAANVLNAGQASGQAEAHKVRSFYPYAHVRSWENHGEMVIIEVARKSDGKVQTENVRVKADDDTCNAILKSIHTCISLLMERKKAEKKAKDEAEKAGTAGIADLIAGANTADAPAPAPAPKPPSQQERFRRASLVVDVAAMADFAEDDVDETPTAIGPLGVVTPKKPQMDFATRRNSVLAQTGEVARRMSLVGGIGNVMNAAGGGGSAEDMMAAAVAAIDMEDDFEEAGISGGKVMADVVGVLTEDGGEDGVDKKSEEGIRRMSLMADVSGEATPAAGSERERRASMLLDLAAFIEEGEDGKGEGFDSATTTAFDTIAEEDEDEDDEEDEFDDFDELGDAEEDMDDFDMLGTPQGDTSVI